MPRGAREENIWTLLGSNPASSLWKQVLCPLDRGIFKLVHPLSSLLTSPWCLKQDAAAMVEMWQQFIFRVRGFPGIEVGKEMEKKGRAPARMKIFGTHLEALQVKMQTNLNAILVNRLNNGFSYKLYSIKHFKRDSLLQNWKFNWKVVRSSMTTR